MNRYIGEEFDLTRLYENLHGYSLPVFSQDRDLVSQLPQEVSLGVFDGSNKQNAIGVDMIMPLDMGINENEMWSLPLEPMVSITGGNRIIRRYPNRSTTGGSYKERWSSDDFSISIKGAFVDFQGQQYPEEEVQQLKEICTHKGNILLQNTLFRILGIERMVIQKFDIPFTPGIAAQGFSISGYSDELFDALLVETNQNSL